MRKGEVMPVAIMPEYVRNVLNTLEANGHKAYLVGGCLRDMLLGRDIHDWDVATSALCPEIITLFPKTVETGARFGTVTVITESGLVEVTTFRSDGVYTDKRRPDDVRFVDDLGEDLKRRDFTINAMAMTNTGLLSDPFDGQADIKRRVIRCVGRAEDRFSEDALRLFRALRFSAQLSFDIEDETMKAIKKCAHLCAALSAERVRDETEKILQSDRPETAGKAVAYGLFAGRLLQSVDLPENLDKLSTLPKDRLMRWAAFCAVLKRAGLIESAQEFLYAMRLDAKTVRYAGAGSVTALAGPLPDNRMSLKRLMADIGVEASLCAAAAEEILRGGSTIRSVEEVISSGECYSFSELAVTGDDLIARGIAPGIGLGDMLKKLLEHVIENPLDNNRVTLLKIVDRIN